MPAMNLRAEEKTGLMLALFLHLALLAALVLQLLFKLPPPPPPIERVTVSLAEEVGLEAQAPEPVPESRAAIAPTLSETPVLMPPPPMPDTRPAPQPRPSAKPTAKPSPRTTRAPVNQDTRRRPDRPDSRPTTRATQKPAGGSRIGSDFLPGAGSSTTTQESRPPASAIGASAKASLLQSVLRQIKPHWSAPDGADADKLYTLVSPTCKPTQGVTDGNRPQAERHCDYAIRAVRRAAPFKLPDEYYNAWKTVRDVKFSGTL
jgi:protein TonB